MLGRSCGHIDGCLGMVQWSTVAVVPRCIIIRGSVGDVRHLYIFLMCVHVACSGVDRITCLARLPPPSLGFKEKFIKVLFYFFFNASSCLTISSRESELQRAQVHVLALGLEIMNHLKAL